MLPAGSVAVAVTAGQALVATGKVTLKVASPLPSVVTIVEPMKVWPCPLLNGLKSAVMKNSIRYWVLGALLSVPWMVVLLPDPLAEVSTGQFCRLFAPASPSPESLAVSTSSPRSMPLIVFAKIAFERTVLPVLVGAAGSLLTMAMPVRLKAMVLLAPAAVPPIRVFGVS